MRGAALAGLAEVAADLREGSRKDALLYAASANASHGLRRTNADKRRAVLLVLGACSKWSDRRIAEVCGVGNKFVGDVRRQVCSEHTPKPSDAEGESATAPEGSEALDLDATVARLTRALQRLLTQWPAERRDELEGLLREEICPKA